MSLVSMAFVLLLAAATAGYYLIAGKYQWIWLLGFSYLYYLSCGGKAALFLVFTTLTTYAAGRFLEKYERKSILVIGLLLNFGMLALLKYSNFAISNLNSLTGSHISFRNFVLPLGISFYTFQSMGYLLDVYWKKVKPEMNVFRFALFVSFFPQLLQGPIGRYHKLAGQLYERHAFSLERLQLGVQRILWGYFKKLVLADRAAPVVNLVFQDYSSYSGVTVIFALLCYSIQLYCDFSGGMDVVIGAAQLFGVSLDENFKRPYFAVSISDFWRRWHITLGTWMKDYVFYPFNLSRAMKRFGKWTKKVFGRQYGRLLPICAGNLLVFWLVGVWHGPDWKFIFYGLYHGILIVFSSLMAMHFQNWKKRLHIRDESPLWKGFQMARTFVLVNISWYFDMAVSLEAAFAMMKSTVVGFRLSAVTDGSLLQLGLGIEDFLILAAGCLTVLAVSVLQERGVSIRSRLSDAPLALRWGIYLALILSMAALGQIEGTEGGFIYAQF